MSNKDLLNKIITTKDLFKIPYQDINKLSPIERKEYIKSLTNDLLNNEYMKALLENLKDK